MGISRDELRDQLRATLEAAPELDGESRQELADVFLQELDRNFTLVPRGSALPASGEERVTYRRGRRQLGAFTWPLAMIVPLLLVLSFAVHIPLFLFAIVLFVILRSVRRPGWRGGPPIYHV